MQNEYGRVLNLSIFSYRELIDKVKFSYQKEIDTSKPIVLKCLI